MGTIAVERKWEGWKGGPHLDGESIQTMRPIGFAQSVLTCIPWFSLPASARCMVLNCMRFLFKRRDLVTCLVGVEITHIRHNAGPPARAGEARVKTADSKTYRNYIKFAKAKFGNGPASKMVHGHTLAPTDHTIRCDRPHGVATDKATRACGTVTGQDRRPGSPPPDTTGTQREPRDRRGNSLAGQLLCGCRPRFRR